MAFEQTRCELVAGLLIVRIADMKILLIKRSKLVNLPGFWAIPGGKVEFGEPQIEAALREGEEELGCLPWDLQVEEIPAVCDDCAICFSVFLGTTQDCDWKPVINWESDQWGWFDVRKLPYPLMTCNLEVIEELLC